MDVLTKRRRERGEVALADLEPFMSQPVGALLVQLGSSTAATRTCAAVALGNTRDPETVAILCRQLRAEEKLYCRIAISAALVRIGSPSVPSLLALLGRIGDNHEKEIPRIGFRKRSFPLPRDIAARALCRMGSGILEDVQRFAEATTSAFSIEQAIDVVGHIVYSNRVAFAPDFLLQIASEHAETSMVRFKVTRCLSGFSDPQTRQFLLQALQSSHIGFKYEAARSLVLSGLGMPDSNVGLPNEVVVFAEQLAEMHVTVRAVD